MINFLLVKDKEIPVYLKYWYYKTKIEGLVFNKIYEATKVGTSLVLDNTIEHSMKIKLLSSDTTQDGTPTPDFPQDIHVVKGDNNININNKNLININGIYSSTDTETFQRSYTNNIATLIWTSGFNLYMTQDNSQNQPLNIFNNSKTYTLSFKHKGDKLNLRFDETTINILSTNTDNDYESYSYTFTGISNLVIKFVRKDASGTAYLKDFQIEEGTTATPYVAHEEQSYTITLSDAELCKIGDYQDLIFKNTSDSEYYDNTLEENKWYKLGKIGKYVFDGSENITIFSSDAQKTVFQVGDITNLYKYSINTSKPILLTTKFISISQSDTWVSGNISMRRQDEANLKVYFILETNKTVNELRNIILDEPLYFLTATPTKTLLSDTLQEELDSLENATSYNEQTNITQINDDRPFILDVSYFRKVKYNE